MAKKGADLLPRERTRQADVGGVKIGGGAPVVVQSMTCTDTADAASTLTQVGGRGEAGCDRVRVTLPNQSAVDAFRAVCEASPVPIVADIHFDYRLAIAAVEAGASKLRGPWCVERRGGG